MDFPIAQDAQGLITSLIIEMMVVGMTAPNAPLRRGLLTGTAVNGDWEALAAMVLHQYMILSMQLLGDTLAEPGAYCT